MPPARAWLAGLRAFIIAAGGVLLAQLTQLSGTDIGIGPGAWLVAGITGLIAGSQWRAGCLATHPTTGLKVPLR